MNADESIRQEATLLGRMLEAAGDRASPWHPDELGAILEHQLDAPLESELAAAGKPEVVESQPEQEQSGPPIRTFRELFQHPRPPVELLEATKSFAKRRRNQPDSPLPDEITTLLYFLAIVLARTRRGVQISGLDGQALLNGLDWASQQPWLDPTVRELLSEGIASLDA